MKRKVWMAGLLFTTFPLVSCCCEDDPVASMVTEMEGSSLYVIPAKSGDFTYLVTASSLDEGEVSTEGVGTEVVNASYWVYKDNEYAFALVYNKSGAGTGASYFLNGKGMPEEKYNYLYNRITTYWTWGDNVITVSTGDSKILDEKGNYAQALLFNYLNSKDGSQSNAIVNAENFLGNGEKVHFAGIVEANNRLYASVIPGGMSLYGINQWPDAVTDPTLITQEAGGSGSGAYTAGIIPSTQYPDKAFIAIYNGNSFEETPIIAETDKIGFACGRMRSQYYQTIWATNDGDLYVFSSGYGRSFVSTNELKKIPGTLPSGVVRIKAGETDFDPDYYVNIETLGNGNPMFRCWYIDGDYFLLQLYKNGVKSMINDGKDADVSELAVFDAVNRTLRPVVGLPTNMSIGGEPYGEDGVVYIPVNTTSDAYPCFYKIDAETATATKGLIVKAESIQTVGKLNIKNE